jgi:hypothetical protein
MILMILKMELLDFEIKDTTTLEEIQKLFKNSNIDSKINKEIYTKLLKRAQNNSAILEWIKFYCAPPTVIRCSDITYIGESDIEMLSKMKEQQTKREQLDTNSLSLLEYL